MLEASWRMRVTSLHRTLPAKGGIRVQILSPKEKRPYHKGMTASLLAEREG
jgi:hypothetical protein